MLKKYLIENWKNFTGKNIPDTLQIAPITSCLEDYGNDIILIFTNKDTYPQYILKASRNPAYGYKLENEFLSLKALKLNQNLSRFIPVPYYLGHYNQNTFFLQQGFTGESLFKIIRQKGVNQKVQTLIDKSIDLLFEIGKSKNSYTVDHLQKFKKFEAIDWPIETGLNETVSNKKVEEIKTYYLTLREKNKTFYTHGDYWHLNILADYKKTRLNGIIDWEFSLPHEFYPKDIIIYMLNLAYCLGLLENSQISIFQAYKQSFFITGKHNNIITSCYKRYMEKINWDMSLFNILLVLTLIELSTRELRTYGRHAKMDTIWKEVLTYTIKNEGKIVTAQVI